MRRAATQRHYLMVRPTYFEVAYSINPWMDPTKPIDRELAIAQWEGLRDLLLHLGHRVSEVDPVPGLPDMVFVSNGATVLGGRALVARFLHGQRSAESAAYLEWFAAQGYHPVRQAQWVNEGEGDYLVAPVGPSLGMLAGSGFRTDAKAHAEAEEYFGVPMIGLTLVDPRFYHLDTALAVLGEDLIMYYPQAFADDSRLLLEELYPDAITASPGDAAAFGLNARSDGLHVVLPQAATGLIAQLSSRGFEPVGVDLSELQKAGGSVKCCTLELRAKPQKTL